MGRKARGWAVTKEGTWAVTKEGELSRTRRCASGTPKWQASGKRKDKKMKVCEWSTQVRFRRLREREVCVLSGETSHRIYTRQPMIQQQEI